MTDFSDGFIDPLEVARRRHGFANAEDLLVLDRLVALAAGNAGAATLRLEDRDTIWYDHAEGASPEGWRECSLSLEETDVSGRLQLPASISGSDLDAWAAQILDTVRIRRMVSERRRRPRGAEGASFVPGVVHELRNLLFALGGGLDALEIRFRPGGEEAVHVAAVRKNLVRFSDFLAELKAYADPAVMVFELVPVLPVLAEAQRLAEPLAGRRDLSLSTEDLPDAALRERMSRDSLLSALRQLIELVAMETRNEGAVALRATVMEGQDRPWLRITVKGTPDRGRELELERLFEPFYYRAPDMPRLGPATSRRTIEAHGGQIAASREGGGFVLSALLPVWQGEPA